MYTYYEMEWLTCKAIEANSQKSEKNQNIANIIPIGYNPPTSQKEYTA